MADSTQGTLPVQQAQLTPYDLAIAQQQAQKILAAELMKQGLGGVAGNLVDPHATGTLLNILGPGLQGQRGQEMLADTTSKEMQLLMAKQLGQSQAISGLDEAMQLQKTPGTIGASAFGPGGVGEGGVAQAGPETYSMPDASKLDQATLRMINAGIAPADRTALQKGANWRLLSQIAQHPEALMGGGAAGGGVGGVSNSKSLDPRLIMAAGMSNPEDPMAGAMKASAAARAEEIKDKILKTGYGTDVLFRDANPIAQTPGAAGQIMGGSVMAPNISTNPQGLRTAAQVNLAEKGPELLLNKTMTPVDTVNTAGQKTQTSAAGFLPGGTGGAMGLFNSILQGQTGGAPSGAPTMGATGPVAEPANLVPRPPGTAPARVAAAPAGGKAPAREGYTADGNIAPLGTSAKSNPETFSSKAEPMKVQGNLGPSVAGEATMKEGTNKLIEERQQYTSLPKAVAAANSARENIAKGVVSGPLSDYRMKVFGVLAEAGMLDTKALAKFNQTVEANADTTQAVSDLMKSFNPRFSGNEFNTELQAYGGQKMNAQVAEKLLKMFTDNAYNAADDYHRRLNDNATRYSNPAIRDQRIPLKEQLPTKYFRDMAHKSSGNG